MAEKRRIWKDSLKKKANIITKSNSESKQDVNSSTKAESPIRMDKVACDEMYSKLSDIFNDSYQAIEDKEYKNTNPSFDQPFSLEEPILLSNVHENNENVDPNFLAAEKPENMYFNVNISLKYANESSFEQQAVESQHDFFIMPNKIRDYNLNIVASPPSANFCEVTYSPHSGTPVTNFSTENNSPMPDLFSELSSPMPPDNSIVPDANISPQFRNDNNIRRADIVVTPMSLENSDFGNDQRNNNNTQSLRRRSNKFSIKNFIKKKKIVRSKRSLLRPHLIAEIFSDSEDDLAPPPARVMDSSESEKEKSPQSSTKCKRNMPKKTNPGKKREKNTNNWLDQVRKVRCNLGKAYKSRDGTVKEEKIMKKPCQCKQKCSRKIPEMLRKKIFKRYWALGEHVLQWHFIIKYVKRIEKKRKTTGNGELSRRTNTFKYFLPVLNVAYPVCQVMFLNTLGISKMTVYTALEKNETETKVIDNRGKHENHKCVVNQEVIQSVVDHVNALEPVESHYVRKQSSRKYLDQDLSFLKMFHLYEKWCTEREIPISDQAKTARQYRDIVNKHLNVGFFMPKKDICDVCHQFKNLENPSEHQKVSQAKHLEAKTVARQIKNNEKQESVNNPQVVTATFDFQKVLTCPAGEISVFYYKRKLNLYNLTVFELGSKTGLCYMWHQGIAKRGSNEVASCLFHFINEHAKKGVTDFRFWSDNCTGQNRNRIVFYMYLYVARILQVKISHKFLEKGHTQNEGDSVHALIERNAKGKTIYSPAEWFSLVRWCKINEPLYVVHEVQQNDIYDFKTEMESKYWTKNTDNEKIKWTEIKEVFVDFTKDDDDVENIKEGQIYYKLDLNEDDYKILNCEPKKVLRTRRKTVPSPQEIQRAYSKPLPLPSLKISDLQELCKTNIIPTRYHEFYNSFQTRANDDLSSDSNED